MRFPKVPARLLRPGIHTRLLNRVLRFPLEFFDTTPTGRILNRFAHDVDQVDTQISQALEQQMEWSLRAAIALVLVCSILPPILVFIFPIMWGLNFVGQLFRHTSRTFQLDPFPCQHVLCLQSIRDWSSEKNAVLHRLTCRAWLRR